MDNFEDLGKDLKPVKITTKRPVGSQLLTMDGDRCIYYADGTWEIVKTGPGIHWAISGSPFLRRVSFGPEDSKLKEAWESLLAEDAAALKDSSDEPKDK